eukprot:2050416-Rhodomonas_salina.3
MSGGSISGACPRHTLAQYRASPSERHHTLAQYRASHSAIRLLSTGHRAMAELLPRAQLVTSKSNTISPNPRTVCTRTAEAYI